MSQEQVEISSYFSLGPNCLKLSAGAAADGGAPPGPAPDRYLMQGGGAQVALPGGLLLGGGGESGGARAEVGVRQIASGGGSGFVHVGWRLPLRRGLRLLPLVGLGYGGTGGLISARHSRRRDKELAYSYTAPLLDLSLTLELRLGGAAGVVIGLRFGCLLPLGSRRLLGRPYTRLVFGFGGARSLTKRT